MHVPEHLRQQILDGRCVAFVGAGFSAPVFGGWRTLLENLARKLPDSSERQELLGAITRADTALDFEALGQIIKDHFPHREKDEAFRSAVAELLKANPEQALMARRVRLLNEIPFRAVLTLNLDGYLDGTTPNPRSYWDLLRTPLHWWQGRTWTSPELHLTRPLIKLHGDAADLDTPIVLTRADYRRLLYEDGRYGNFLRTVLATHTMLFLGVSFTDAYLNEIRSEILSLLGPDAGSSAPLGYAVLHDKSPEWRDYFRKHEGIEVLPYETIEAKGFEGFDTWLKSIHAETAPVNRLRKLLGGKRIIWLDPRAEENNEYGLQYLDEALVRVEKMRSPEQLANIRDWRDIELVITHYGYKGPGEAVAFDVLAKLGALPDRPPVVVFASGSNADKNRHAVLRRGAAEYACEWQDLFGTIERLFGAAGDQ